MSIGPQGNWVSGIVGAHAAQQRSGEVDRKTAESTNQIAAAQLDKQSAADGSLQANEEAQDRDADGRDLSRHQRGDAQRDSQGGETGSQETPHQSLDPSGQLGRRLDLSG